MATLQQRFHAWLSDSADETVLRWIFRSIVAVTVVVLGVDLVGMNGWLIFPDPAAPAEIKQDSPSWNLPSVLAPLSPGGDKRLTPLPQPEGVLAKPMSFELVGGGRLIATGTITPGISEAFANEVGKRGDYIKTVVLNSPGGSVADALAMGRLIREKKFATEVEAGKYCASSCPLLFAGGTERRAVRQGGHRRASGCGNHHRIQCAAARRDARGPEHLGALPALPRRRGHQFAGLGPCDGNPARQTIRVHTGRNEVAESGDDNGRCSAGFHSDTVCACERSLISA
jgi:hypothetical protein